MFIWIPINENKNITKLSQVKKWALVNFDEGEVKSIEFFNSRSDFKGWVDFIILENSFEPSMEFMQEGMVVLCVRTEKTIDEIMEAFKFKELDEVGF